MFLFPLFLLFSTLTLCSINFNYPSQTCVCDITTICDYLCCCDTTCPTDTLLLWKSNNLCEPANNKGLAINFCSAPDAAQVTDLHSGLRMIYDIIKRLFCIQTVNHNASDGAYKTQISHQQASSLIGSYMNSYSTSGFTNPYSTFQKTLTLNGNVLQVPMAQGNGRCGWGDVYIGIDVPVKKCLGSSSSASFSVQQFITNLNNSGIQTNFSIINSDGTARSTNLGFVTQGIIELTMNDDQSNIILIEVELVVVDSLANGLYSTIQHSFKTTWKSQQATNFSLRSGNVGYQYGSSLLVVDSDNNLRSTPLRVIFSDLNGNCIQSSPSAANIDLWDIKFGYDFAAFCKGSSSTDLRANIHSVFTRLGAFGSSNASLPQDFVQVVINDNTISLGKVLRIYYSRIGTSDNSMFEIKSSTLQSLTTTSSSTTLSFFVQFVEIPSVASIFTPPPPNAQLYLDKDVLYPFYTYE